MNQKIDKSRVSGHKAHYVYEPGSRDEQTGKFTHKYNEPLTQQPYGTRLPQSIAEKMDRLLGKDKRKWMREVLVAAVENLEEQEENCVHIDR